MTVLLTDLENIVRAAGEIALTHFKNIAQLKVTKKSPRDFVTEADVSVEVYLKETLAP